VLLLDETSALAQSSSSRPGALITCARSTARERRPRTATDGPGPTKRTPRMFRRPRPIGRPVGDPEWHASEVRVLLIGLGRSTCRRRRPPHRFRDLRSSRNLARDDPDGPRFVPAPWSGRGVAGHARQPRPILGLVAGRRPIGIRHTRSLRRRPLLAILTSAVQDAGRPKEASMN